MHTRDQQAVLAFLRQDLLRNIVPLKMLTAFPAAIETAYHQAGSEAAALLRFPTSAFPYDRATYGHLDQVVLLAATSPQAATALLPAIPRDQKLIFKLADPGIYTLLANHFALQRVTAFLSYTATPSAAVSVHPDVVIADQVAAALIPLFAAQGHDNTELQGHFATGQARTYALYQNTEPIAACFTFQNFEQVHEIGGVFTIPQARRQGHAQKVVATAAHTLLARGFLPRYQVHEINQPSIALAEQIGLTRFVTVAHWCYLPT
ncbi:MAG: GNAT family N-acetyltransferase [Caldilineaceae bacterium]|nr:GNAT family N-acetyltransferase [Caldilineaceae bacterium]